MTTKEYMDNWRKDNREKMRAYSKKHYAKNKEKLRKEHAKHYVDNRDDYVKRLRKNHLKRNYNITIEYFENLLLEQNGKCAICGVEFKKLKPCVDHNHTNGKVRGLLCRPCNLSLSVVEKKEFVIKANQYLQASEVKDKEPLR